MPVLTPAYGRVYETFEDVDFAYCTGKDFIFHDPSSRWNGKYCSVRDFFGQKVELRFGKHLQLASVIMCHKQEKESVTCWCAEIIQLTSKDWNFSDIECPRCGTDVNIEVSVD